METGEICHVWKVGVLINLSKLLCGTIQHSNSSGDYGVSSLLSGWILCHFHNFGYNCLRHLRHLCNLSWCQSLPGPGTSFPGVSSLEAGPPLRSAFVRVSQGGSGILRRHGSSCKCPISRCFYRRRAAMPGVIKSTGAPDCRGRRAAEGFVRNGSSSALLSTVFNLLCFLIVLHLFILVCILACFVFDIHVWLGLSMLLLGLPLSSSLVALLQEGLVRPHMLGLLAQAAGPADKVPHNPSAQRLVR